MNRILTVSAAVLLLAVSPAYGELCDKCRDRSYTKDIGVCVECDGMTTSGAFKLCMKCSDRLRQCQHCRASLPAAAVAPIDQERDGTYQAGRWTYDYRITNKGSRSQGRQGRLFLDGVPVPEPDRINDFYETPWGPLYWIGEPVVAFGAHGWMPNPLMREPVGRRLPEPPAAGAPGAALNVPTKAVGPDCRQLVRKAPGLGSCSLAGAGAARVAS